MAPFVFSDIGKAAGDLLGKDFPVGSVRLEAKTTASNGVAFTVLGIKDNKTGGIVGDIKARYNNKAKGLTITDTWTSSNVLSGEIELADSLASGLKLNVIGSLVPSARQKNARVALDYKHHAVAVRSSLDVFKGPFGAADIAFNYNGFITGVEAAYDLNAGKTTRHTTAFGYVTSEYALALHAANKFNTFSGSYYHRVNKQLETGGRATWDRKAGSQVLLEVAAKYHIDPTAFVKAKIDNAGKVGLGYSQLLRPGVRVVVGGIVDTARLEENGHKLGMSIMLDA